MMCERRHARDIKTGGASAELNVPVEVASIAAQRVLRQCALNGEVVEIRRRSAGVSVSAIDHQSETPVQELVRLARAS